MLKVRGQIVSCVVLAALALAAAVQAAPAPAPVQPQAPPAVSSGAVSALSPAGVASAPGQLQPVFLSTITDCQNNCRANYNGCIANHNPFSVCWQIYQNCLCSCNDSCNP